MTLRSAGWPPWTAGERQAFLGRASALWLFLIAGHVVLFLRVSGSAAHVASLPIALRVRLGLLEPGWLIPIAFLLTWLVNWRDDLRARKADWFMRGLAASVAFAAFGFFLVTYGASWFTLMAVGRFPDPAALAYALASPLDLLQTATDIDPFLAIAVPGAALILAMLLDAVLLRVRAPRAVLIAAGIVALADVGGMLVLRPDVAAQGRRLTKSVNGMQYTLGEEYALVGGQRSGPIVSLVTGWLRPEADRELALAGLARQVAWHRIKSPANYATDSARAALQPYNVVLLVVESLRSDQLKAYGSTLEVMPNVDQLAAEGRTFTDMYSTATQSNLAAIVPASGQYPLRASALEPYPEDIPYPRTLLYDQLKPLGYRTGLFSSQNEAWGGMVNFLRSRGLDTLLDAENYDGPTYVPRGDAAFVNFVRGTKHAGKLDDRYTISEAIQWTTARDPHPFFVSINLQDSHFPYDVPSDFPPRFGTGDVSFPLEFGEYPPDSTPAVLAKYRNSLAYVDMQIGRLVAALKAHGLWDRTIMVITGDHGEAFYEHGVSAHANGLFEEELRVPLIIRAPGLAPGLDRHPASHIDVVPTVLDLLHLPPHPGMQGVSLLRQPLHSDRSRYFVVLSPLAKRYGVEKDSLKLTVDAETGDERLNDLRTDPAGSIDVAAKRPQDAAWLRRQVEAWRAVQLYYYGDQFAMARYFPPVLDELPVTSELK